MTAEDDNRDQCTMAGILRDDVEHGDPESLRYLCAHVVRRLTDDSSVDTEALQLLLEHMPVSVETDKREQYSEIFQAIRIHQGRTKCSFYAAVQHYHEWLLRQDPHMLGDLQRSVRAKSFMEAFDQLRKECPPRMKWRATRDRKLRDSRKPDV